MPRFTGAARDAFSLLLDAAPDAMVVVDANGAIVMANAPAARLFGYEMGELSGKPIEALVPERYRTAHLHHRASYFRSPGVRPMGAGLELFGRRKDGTEFPVEISLSPVTTDAGPLAISAIRDITTRKRAEAKFRGLLESAPDAILIVDKAGRITLVNAQTERLFGYPRQALLGQPVEMLIPPRFVAGHERHRQDYFAEPGVRPMGAGFELFGRRADGSEFPVEISLSPLETEEGLLVASAIRDITDRKRADEERLKLASEQAARAEAEAANRLKDEFLAMLAHELRNPLAAIQTGLGVLDRVGSQEMLAAETRIVMTRQLRHLSRMVDDLLDVSRVSTGKIVLHREPVDVSEVIGRCIAAVTSKAGANEHAITVRTHPVVADADPMRLEQIVMNLLTNAIKYTPAGGSITVTAGRTSDTAVIVVEDSGIGMTPDLAERVFDLFVQGERSLARSEGGLGIGLTLVKRLVEMHGGSVDARSAGLGRGSSFTIRLPAATPQSRVERHPRPIVSTTPSGRRVLVVEDNADVREMLRMLLQLDGHEVHEAADGPTGVNLGLTVRPDVAFVDIGLPGIDGYEVVRELRARGEGPPSLFVALTGYGRADDRERMQQAGFDAHLIKPVEPARIQDIMLRSRRA